MEWDEAERVQAETAASGGNFVSLPDNGDKMIVAFLGKPEARKNVWDPKMNAYREPKTPDEKATARWSMNVFVLKTVIDKKETAVNDVKIWDCSNKVFAHVIAVKRKYTLDKQFFEIERKGKKDDSSTTYTIFPDIDISPDHAKAFAGCKLHDLVKTDSGDAQTDTSSYDKMKNGTAAAATIAPTTAATTAAAQQAAAATAATANGNLAIISKEKAQEIVGRVKQLPADKLAVYRDWMKSVGITAVMQMSVAHEATAFKKLEELEGKVSAPVEIDPFAIT
jgi:hypothetical protein